MNNGICSKNLQNKYFLIVYNIIAFKFYIYILMKSFNMREREKKREREKERERERKRETCIAMNQTLG